MAEFSVQEINSTHDVQTIESGSGIGILYALALACFGSSRSNDDQAAQYAAAGQQALAQGHYAEAQANFEKLAKLEPGVAEVHATLAAIYFAGT